VLILFLVELPPWNIPRVFLDPAIFLCNLRHQFSLVQEVHLFFVN
jgi:hypothetical protein